MRMRIGRWAVSSIAVGFLLAPAPARALTQCNLTYNLEGWSVFYKAANGRGMVRCDNGQHARVRLETRGGGVTFGSSRIVGGTGHFSQLTDIDEIFGDYANAEAHAGFGASSGAQVVTKGTVSLTLTGTGTGVDVGFAFGRFTIARGTRYVGEEDLPAEPRVEEVPAEPRAVPESY